MTITTALPIPLRVLIIEDNRGDAILITKTIEATMPSECVIAHVRTLEDALQKISYEEFDVALLDRSLPDAKGFNGLNSLQNMAPKLPIIFLTSYQDEKTALEAIQHGAQDYLFKGRTHGDAVKRAIQYSILRKQYEDVLIIRANYDVLTGLANRSLFESRLDMALVRIQRHRSYMSIFFLDLDKFKEVNDNYGHAAGDDLLIQVGERIKKTLRIDDIAARFGGDEFAVLLEDMPTPEYSEKIAQRIIENMKAPFHVDGRELSMHISIGVTSCTARQSISRESILKQVDIAMYTAKSISGSAYHFYDKETQMEAK